MTCPGMLVSHHESGIELFAKPKARLPEMIPLAEQNIATL